MAQAAKYGDAVKVHYTGKLEDGTVFHTSTNHDPLQFTIGEVRSSQALNKPWSG